jgi:hypothetical protein
MDIITEQTCLDSSLQNDQSRAAASKEEHRNIPETRSADTIRNRPAGVDRIHLGSTDGGVQAVSAHGTSIQNPFELESEITDCRVTEPIEPI